MEILYLSKVLQICTCIPLLLDIYCIFLLLLILYEQEAVGHTELMTPYILAHSWRFYLHVN